MLLRTHQHWTQTRRIFFPRHFQPGFSKSICTISKGFQSVSTFWRVSKRFKVPEIGSNILRNKSPSVVEIRETFTCFQHLRPRKCGFLHKTGNSLDFDYLELRQNWWYTYKHTYTQISEISWYWRRKPRLARTQPKLVCKNKNYYNYKRQIYKIKIK